MQIRLSTFKRRKYCLVSSCNGCDELVFDECGKILDILVSRKLIPEHMDEAAWHELETELKEKGVLIED